MNNSSSSTLSSPLASLSTPTTVPPLSITCLQASPFQFLPHRHNIAVPSPSTAIASSHSFLAFYLKLAVVLQSHVSGSGDGGGGGPFQCLLFGPHLFVTTALRGLLRERNEMIRRLAERRGASGATGVTGTSSSAAGTDAHHTRESEKPSSGDSAFLLDLDGFRDAIKMGFSPSSIRKQKTYHRDDANRWGVYPCNMEMFSVRDCDGDVPTTSELANSDSSSVMWILWDVAMHGVAGFERYWREVVRWVERKKKVAQHSNGNNRTESPIHILVTLTNTSHLPHLIETQHAHQTTAELQDKTNRHYAAFLLKCLRERLQQLQQQERSYVASTALLYIPTNEDVFSLQCLHSCLAYYDLYASGIQASVASVFGDENASVRDSDVFGSVFIPPHADSLEKIAQNLDYHLVLNHFASGGDRRDSNGLQTDLRFGQVFGEVQNVGEGNGATQLQRSHRVSHSSPHNTPTMLDFNEYLAEKYIVHTSGKSSLTSASSSANLLGPSSTSASAAFRQLRKNHSSSVLLSGNNSSITIGGSPSGAGDKSGSLLSVPNNRVLRKTHSRPVLHHMQQQQQDVDTPTSAMGNMQQEEAELFFSSMLSQFKKGQKGRK
uniref:Uncharacterized protein n=1 Tax=Percolomonas cosmopolitus TaxID=63605 RepID=A0A7S1KN01_9EUKA